MSEQSPIRNIEMNSSKLQEEIIKKINYESPTKYDLDFYQRKINRIQNQLIQAQDQLALARQRLRKAEDFQIKYDFLVKQNQSLNTQNQKISKELQNQRINITLIKDKLQSSLIKQKENEDYIANLNKEMQQLRMKSMNLQNIKNDEISYTRNEIENKAKKEIQKIKNQSNNTIQKLESDLRKCKKEIVQKSTGQAGILATFQKIRNDKDVQINRLSEKMSELQNQILDIKASHLDQLEQMRKKFMAESAIQSQNISQQTTNLRQLIQEEINKFKKLLNFKNIQIDSLLEDDLRNKERHENEFKALIKEIYEMRDKCEMMQKEMEVQAYNLKQRLLKLFDQERSRQKNSKNQLIHSYQNQISHLKKQLDKKQKQLEHMNQMYNQKAIEFQRLLRQKTMRMQQIQSQKSLTQQRYNQEIKGLRGSLNKIQQESQSHLMQKLSTIQFLQQQTKLLNLSIEHKNRQINTLIKQMDELRKQHCQTLDQLLKVKQKQRNTQNQELSNLRNDISKLQFQLQNKNNQIRMLEHGRQVDRSNAQSERRSYQNTIMLLKSEQNKMMQFAKELDQRLLSQRTKVGDQIVDKSNLDRQRTTQVQKGKSQMQRIIFAERQRLRKQMQAEKQRIRTQLNKMIKQNNDLKRQYNELLAVHKELVGDKERTPGDYQKKLASIDGEIKITEHWLDTMYNVSGRIP